MGLHGVFMGPLDRNRPILSNASYKQKEEAEEESKLHQIWNDSICKWFHKREIEYGDSKT